MSTSLNIIAACIAGISAGLTFYALGILARKHVSSRHSAEEQPLAVSIARHPLPRGPESDEKIQQFIAALRQES